MSADSTRRQSLCPGCHRPVFANEAGASSCAVCGTDYDGSLIAEAQRESVRAKVRKEGYAPDALRATRIPAATGYGTHLVARAGAEQKGDLRLQWEGAQRSRNAFAEFLPVVLAAIVGAAFFPEASMIARLAVAMVAGGLTYVVVLTLVGDSLRFYFEVSADDLLVRQGSMWSRELERIPAQDVDQLYVIGYTKANEGQQQRYEVRCRTRSGELVSICRGLHSLEQALWIEYQIERHLGVVDLPVEGEVNRS